MKDAKTITIHERLYNRLKEIKEHEKFNSWSELFKSLVVTLEQEGYITKHIED